MNRVVNAKPSRRFLLVAAPFVYATPFVGGLYRWFTAQRYRKISNNLNFAIQL
nr:MAG TPA: hypothetical protein [Caudoviricetes sp.]DAU72627.1 MAG TPA: hypothetical protein [Caudoviricetes sp.]